MGRMLTLFVVVLGVAACASRREMNLLDHEIMRFRSENERIRYEDLEANYEAQKRKADVLAGELLALQRERDRRYAAYDDLRADLSRVRREHEAAAAERATLEEALRTERAEVAKLEAELERVRAEAETLRQALEEEAARRRALEAGEAGGRAPG